MAVARERFIEGMRQMPSGVSLVTTLFEGRRAGLTATAVCSVSADPPQLLVCVNRTASAHESIRAAGLFAVNVLAREQRYLADVFAGIDGRRGEARFAEGHWTTLVTGAPVLEDALAAFDCRVVQTIEAASHSIFLGLVEAVAVRPDLAPLVFVEGGYGLTAPLAQG